MAEGRIPINPEDLPTDPTPMNEGDVYTCTLEKVVVAPKLDRSGGMYISASFAVSEGDFEGRNLQSNWIPLPLPIPNDAPKKVRVKIEDRNVSFARFAKAFQIKGAMPIPSSIMDEEGIREFQEYMERFYLNVGRLTIRMGEFNGIPRPEISNYIY